MFSLDKLQQARDFTDLHRVPTPGLQCVFFSVSDGLQRALVVHATAGDFDAAWARGVGLLKARMRRRNLVGRWLRIDWVEETEEVSAEELRERLRQTKRNYFRLGICFDRSPAWSPSRRQRASSARSAPSCSARSPARSATILSPS